VSLWLAELPDKLLARVVKFTPSLECSIVIPSAVDESFSHVKSISDAETAVTAGFDGAATAVLTDMLADGAVGLTANAGPP